MAGQFVNCPCGRRDIIHDDNDHMDVIRHHYKRFGYRDEICPRLRVIVSLQTNRSPVVFVRIVGHEGVAILTRTNS